MCNISTSIFNTLLQLRRNFLLVTRSLLLFTRYSLLFFFYSLLFFFQNKQYDFGNLSMVFHTQPKFWFLFLLFPSGKQQKSSSYQSFLYNLDFNTLLQLKRNFLLVTRSLLLFTRYSLVFFFYLGFLSRTFMIYRTAGEGGD